MFKEIIFSVPFYIKMCAFAPWASHSFLLKTIDFKVAAVTLKRYVLTWDMTVDMACVPPPYPTGEWLTTKQLPTARTLATASLLSGGRGYSVVLFVLNSVNPSRSPQNWCEFLFADSNPIELSPLYQELLQHQVSVYQVRIERFSYEWETDRKNYCTVTVTVRQEFRMFL